VFHFQFSKKKTMAINRRDFIKKASTASAGFFIVPRHVLGKGYTAPSDRLNLASVGAGGKGQSDTINSWNNDKNNVVAIADIDWARAKTVIDKFPKANKYRDWREMFDKEGKNFDAVTVSTPDHNHAAVASAAMAMGKHVYVQKPLTHNIYEARVLTQMARKYKVVTQMGNQGASSSGTKQFVEWFNKGMIGKVDTVYIWTNRPVWPQGKPMPVDKPTMPKDLAWDVWLGPSTPVEYHPLYHPFKWRGWWKFGTGALGDMACHLMDAPFRALGLGYPSEVECSVGSVFSQDWVADYNPESCPPSSTVQLKFGPTAKNKSAVKLVWMDGGIRPFHPDIIPAEVTLGGDGGGVIMMGKKGILTCETYGHNPKIFYKGKPMLEMPKPDPNAVTLPENGHQIMWTEACKAGFDSKEHKSLTSSFDFAGPLTESILMGNLAIRSYDLRTETKPATNGGRASFEYTGRKKLIWDGVNMKITNYEAANQYVKREYRAGWKLTEV
jgi:predicted dehydrogenase